MCSGGTECSGSSEKCWLFRYNSIVWIFFMLAWLRMKRQKIILHKYTWKKFQVPSVQLGTQVSSLWLVCGGMRTGKAENTGNAFLHPVSSTTHPPKGKNITLFPWKNQHDRGLLDSQYHFLKSNWLQLYWEGTNVLLPLLPNNRLYLEA